MPVVRTERLELAPRRLRDLPALRRIYLQADTRRHLGGVPRGRTLWHLGGGLVSGRERQLWTIRVRGRTRRRPGRIVGSVGFGPYDGATELAYWLDPTVWGRGYASEAARAVVASAGVDRLVAVVEPANVASARVLVGLGFVDDGEQARFGRPHRRFVLDRLPVSS